MQGQTPADTQPWPRPEFIMEGHRAHLELCKLWGVKDGTSPAVTDKGHREEQSPSLPSISLYCVLETHFNAFVGFVAGSTNKVKNTNNNLTALQLRYAA